MSISRQLRAAERHICRLDPVMREVIADTGPCSLEPAPARRAFAELVQVIVAQQISTGAARSIHGRLLAACGGRMSAVRLLALDDEAMRQVGMSRQKIVYLRDLAERVRSRRLRLGAFGRMSDEEVVATLSSVKGIGRWTAEVFMIFQLGRLDLMPVDDLGLLDGARLLYDLPERPDGETLLRIAEPWRPYRSVGAWFLWQGRRRARGQPLR